MIFGVVLRPIVRAWSTGRLATIADDHERAVAAWPSTKRDRALAQAKAYNRWLTASGQPTLGVAQDSQAAEAYRLALETPDGVMGTISIPSIGVHLPIRHGTSSDVLSAGAGHLMGTSLPAGGSSTHAVITAHRGLAGASMFTRLDEMAVGDRFSLTVLGTTMTYRVDRVTVIKPEDTAILRISSTEDRVTLMTCTPYGVNTHRLLVSGVRVPNATAEAGRERTSHAGPTTRVWCWIALAAGGLVIGGGIGYLVWRGRRKSGS
jgi:sortase A